MKTGVPHSHLLGTISDFLCSLDDTRRTPMALEGMLICGRSNLRVALNFLNLSSLALVVFA